MLIIFFYVWYVIEWAVHYLRLSNWWAAYYAISFEKEAYANEKDVNYLKRRHFWIFLTYI